MAYDTQLADRVREYLADFPRLEIEEKKMFGGLAFMVNGKMCVNVSGNKLMCRYNPERYDDLSQKDGYETMIMKGKEFTGYCYVLPSALRTKSELIFWIGICLDFNDKAKSSKKKK